MRMYSVTNSGIAAEIYRAGSPADAESGILPDAGARHSLLRPETVESLFLLYRITGEQIYRDWGAQILSSITKHARVPNGKHVASVSDVTSGGGTTATPLSDSLESFFFAETIKYLFLLFSGPETIPLDEWVFNTEAHPLRVWSS
jgi:mannosyl-oligosaccharide alpha-1,2-mannosidase